jgi:hypothetical protein
MKQFVITIPNPIQGKGAKGFDRQPKEGEATFSIFHCYADSEKRAREITANIFDMLKVPDGTKLIEIDPDPRVNSEMFTTVISEKSKEQAAANVIRTYEVVSETEHTYINRMVFNVYAHNAQEAIEVAKSGYFKPLDEYATDGKEGDTTFTASVLISDEQ